MVRNNNNVLVSNHAVGMRISILQGLATGTAVYTDTQTPTTNGFIAIEIGLGMISNGTTAMFLTFNGGHAFMLNNSRAFAFTVRCSKD